MLVVFGGRHVLMRVDQFYTLRSLSRFLFSLIGYHLMQLFLIIYIFKPSIFLRKLCAWITLQLLLLISIKFCWICSSYLTGEQYLKRMSCSLMKSCVFSLCPRRTLVVFIKCLPSVVRWLAYKSIVTDLVVQSASIPYIKFIKMKQTLICQLKNHSLQLNYIADQQYLMIIVVKCINNKWVQLGIDLTSIIISFELAIAFMQQGSIQVIYGPMFSGKSSELLRKIRRYEHAKKKCLVINYLHDNRYSQGEEMATHDRITRKALKTSSLMTLLESSASYDVIGIDEGQFFADIVQYCQMMANSNKIVMVAALDGTFERKPFGNIINLIPKAEKVIKLNAVCVQCTKEAAFTKRVVDSKEIELIGGQEMYKPVCRVCFFAIRKQPKIEQELTTSKEANIPTISNSN